MPTDRRGKKLRPGDIVCIPCVVMGIDPHPEFINVMLETCEPAFPGEAKTPLLMNARQTDLIEARGESDPDMNVRRAIEESNQRQGE
jgi:hypothetical protein